MALLRDYLVDERAEILGNDIRLTTIGNLERLPDFVREPLLELQAASAGNQGMTLCLALSYGGREAIVDAARALVEACWPGELRPQDVNELSLAEALCTRSLPPLDLVIRTVGRAAAVELPLVGSAPTPSSTSPTRCGPTSSAPTCMDAIATFQGRERRFGLTSEQVKLRAIAPK